MSAVSIISTGRGGHGGGSQAPCAAQRSAAAARLAAAPASAAHTGAAHAGAAHASPARAGAARAGQRWHPAGPARAGARVPQIAIRIRMAAGVLIAAALVALVASLWLAGAGSAQAAGRARPHAGMTRIVVRPGQTLWGIASTAEPAADTFQVIQQIAAVNRLPGTTIEAGQVLWVPGR